MDRFGCGVQNQASINAPVLLQTVGRTLFIAGIRQNLAMSSPRILIVHAVVHNLVKVCEGKGWMKRGKSLLGEAFDGHHRVKPRSVKRPVGGTFNLALPPV
jgi:hypothetical protein